MLSRSVPSSWQYGLGGFPSFASGLRLFSALISSSILTTHRIEGRLIGRGLVQRRPMLRTLHISSLKHISRFGSITRSTPFCSKVLHTHFTKSLSPYSGSTGRFPVTSSRITTPKLYMSLFSFTRSVYAYSAGSRTEQDCLSDRKSTCKNRQNQNLNSKNCQLTEEA